MWGNNSGNRNIERDYSSMGEMQRTLSEKTWEVWKISALKLRKQDKQVRQKCVSDNQQYDGFDKMFCIDQTW